MKIRSVNLYYRYFRVYRVLVVYDDSSVSEYLPGMLPDNVKDFIFRCNNRCDNGNYVMYY